MTRTTLYTYEQISARIDELADEINASFSGKSLLCVCVLRGAFMFFSELMRRLEGDIAVDFVSAKSYDGTKAGELQLLLDIREDLVGKNVLIVEDIVDSGATVDFLRRLFLGRGAADVKIACLLDKPLGRKADISPDYCAFTLKGNDFVVGFGLDYDGQFRTLDRVEEVHFD